MLNAHNNSPVFGRHAFNYAIQHYNARCHMVRVCTELLGQHHICMLPWTVLPHIYDKFYYLFNESENVHVRHRPKSPQTREKGSNVPQDLVKYMRHRCEAVVVAQGGHTC